MHVKLNIRRVMQEIRSREEEMSKQAEEQKKHEDMLKKREEEINAREQEIFERELHYMIQEQGSLCITDLIYVVSWVTLAASGSDMVCCCLYTDLYSEVLLFGTLLPYVMPYLWMIGLICC